MAIPPPLVPPSRQAWKWQWHQLMGGLGRSPMPKATITAEPGRAFVALTAAAQPAPASLVSSG